MLAETARALVVLLSLYRPRAFNARRIEARREAIITAASEASVRYEVPASLLLTIGFLETHLGTDAGEGGNWGAPEHPNTPSVAGTPANAASALAWGFRECHTWLGAVRHFRSGLCRHVQLVGYDENEAIRIAARVTAAAGLELPARWR